jgi:DNA-directed RNA polymerase subunit RPC12/RpoP
MEQLDIKRFYTLIIEENTVNIPYWLFRLPSMWDYLCPKCKKEVKKNSHRCPHCGERFPLAVRVPPIFLKDPKSLEEYVHKRALRLVFCADKLLNTFDAFMIYKNRLGTLSQTLRFCNIIAPPNGANRFLQVYVI